MKRGRNNQRRRPGGGNPNRALDSNGPDVRIRGTANQIHDKYQTLARDAQSAGDRVKAENYLQHAEHYFRLMKALQPTPQPQSDNAEASGEQPSVGQNRDERESREDRDGRDNRGRRPRHNNNGRGESQSKSDAADASDVADQAKANEHPVSDVEEAAAANTSEKPSTDAAADSDEKPEPERKPARKRRARRTTKTAEEKDEAVTS